MASTMVDFMPKISTTGDFKKITDSNLLVANNKVSTLLNHLEMVAGRNSIYTDFGCYQDLVNIEFSEDPEKSAAAISQKISHDLNFPVSVDFNFDENDEIMNVELTVDNLPQKIQMEADKSRRRVRFINPKLV